MKLEIQGMGLLSLTLFKFGVLEAYRCCNCLHSILTNQSNLMKLADSFSFERKSGKKTSVHSGIYLSILLNLLY